MSLDNKEYKKKWNNEHKEQMKLYKKKWDNEHKEQNNLNKKKWREKNINKVKEILKKSREKCKEKIKERDKKYRKENIEKRRIYNNKWYHENIEHSRELYSYHSAMRRANKKNSLGFYTLEDWQMLKKQHNYMCLVCKRKEPEIKLTKDHIVPLSKGGSNYINNIQPLCKSCNSVKNNKI